MELTTSDAQGDQASRIPIYRAADNADLRFYRGGRSAENLTMVYCWGKWKC